MTLRRTLFTVHMWIGLVLGLFLAVLGLSGSLIVYDEKLGALLDPPPHATAAGDPLPLTMIADAARQAASAKGYDGQMQIVMPDAPGDAIAVRVGQISVMGNMPGMEPRRRGGAGRREGGRGGLQVFVDPVSGEVLGTRNAVLPSFLTFAHQLHGNFLMGRDGRSLVVGWLGVAMCLLGLSGLVLWWPRKGQWKYAFFVRRTAKGLRFHRELHAATGIWIFVVFIAVSFSGVVLAWPRTLGAPEGPRAPVVVENTGAKPIGAQEAVNAANAAMPGAVLRSVSLPARPGQAISVTYLSHGAVNATVLVDPYSGKVLVTRDPSESFLAWMRPVHQGSLGPVWKFLVFLSGLVPSLFVITGIIMWTRKRRRRVPMTMMTDDVTEADAA